MLLYYEVLRSQRLSWGFWNIINIMLNSHTLPIETYRANQLLRFARFVDNVWNYKVKVTLDLFDVAV